MTLLLCLKCEGRWIPAEFPGPGIHFSAPKSQLAHAWAEINALLSVIRSGAQSRRYNIAPTPQIDVLRDDKPIRARTRASPSIRSARRHRRSRLLDHDNRRNSPCSQSHFLPEVCKSPPRPAVSPACSVCFDIFGSIALISLERFLLKEAHSLRRRRSWRTLLA